MSAETTGVVDVGGMAEATSVLAVGLERYDLPTDWDLPGAASQAVRFAEWAIGQGVDPGRVRLGCTWVDDAGRGTAERLGVRTVEVGNESLLATIDELMEEGGDLLLVYWCGHGVAGNQLERRLLTSGASERNLANRFVADIQARFQSTVGTGFARQVFIIDACANIMEHHDGEKRALPDSRMQPLGVRKASQDFYFATDVGEYAQFDKATGTAAYSTAILNRLTATGTGGVFPPDLEKLFGQVEEDLVAGSFPHPVSLSFTVHGSGSTETVIEPDRVRVVGNRVSAAVAFWRDRDELREWLRGKLLAGQPITSIYGRPGIGKSAVVAKVLAAFEQADPARSPLEDIDGLVYMSTRTKATTLTPAHVYEAVTDLVEPSRRRELESRWESLDTGAFPSLWDALKHRRVVVVLDHLDDLQNPHTLELADDRLLDVLRSVTLAPSRPRIVTTSRERLNLPADLLASVAIRELKDGLGRADGVALLRSFPDPNGTIGVQTDESLARVVELVEGVPHGLELVASNASNDHSFIGKLLTVTEAPDAILRTLVSRNYDNLDDTSHCIVGLLAMARMPLSEPDIPQLLSGMVDPSAAAEAVGQLIDARTVGFEPRPAPEPGLVRLHPLDADYVRTTLMQEEASLQISLDTHLADWFRSARRPRRTWRTSGDVDPNLREFEHRWRAAREIWERTAALAPLAEAAEFISRKGETRRLKAAIDRVAQQAQEPAGSAYVETCRFFAEFFGGSLAHAKDAARAAIDHAKDGALPRLEAEMHLWLGIALRHSGEAEEAARVLQEVLDADDESMDSDTKVDALLEIGLAYCYLREWNAAEAAADQLDSMASQTGEAKCRAQELDVRALARLGVGDYESAVKAATRAMPAYAEAAMEDCIAYLHNVCGLASMYQGDLDAAENELRTATDIARRYGQGRLEGICTTNLTWCAMSRSNWTDAAALASHAADCLAAVGARENAIAQQLVSVLQQGVQRESAWCLRILTAAAVDSRTNTDFYCPPDDLIPTLASQLAARSH